MRKRGLTYGLSVRILFRSPQLSNSSTEFPTDTSLAQNTVQEFLQIRQLVTDITLYNRKAEVRNGTIGEERKKHQPL